ncbi:MAG TPA: PspA/IM30 family protein [Candidatus Saccharimonas sp.]|nr:PspA/IM30 family protein [Candidatus Saccharimonas sp.]
MANPFVKGWKYFMALLGHKIDEYADPAVVIQQAIEELQRGHQGLVQQAASVIGNQRQLEMQMSRRQAEVGKLTENARQALVLAAEARTSGDEEKAQEYERTAQTFATQLVTAEELLTDLVNLHKSALAASTQARRAVEDNAQLLQGHLAERTKLLSQLEQAKMQETVAKSLEIMGGTAQGSGPSFDEVREQIERRFATALGRADLAANSPEGLMRQVQQATAINAGAARVAQLRAEIEAGASPAAITADADAHA